MVKTYRVAFVGNIIHTPEFILSHARFNLAGLVSESWQNTESIFHYVTARGLPHRVAENGGMALIDALSELGKLDAVVMCSYGRKVMPEVLSLWRFFNIHYAALPTYKGRHPTFWATVSGETRLGITLHEVVAGIDEGHIVTQRTIDYPLWLTEADGFHELTSHTPDLLNGLAGFLDGTNEGFDNEPGHYFPPVTEADTTIDLHKDDPATVINKVRAQFRYGGALLRAGGLVFRVRALRFIRAEGDTLCGHTEEVEGRVRIGYRPGITIELIDMEPVERG